MRKILALFLVILMAGLAIAGCGQQAEPKPEPKPQGSESPAPEPSGPKTGGTLKIVFDAEPPTLDMQLTTSVVTFTIAWHMFENLFALDKDGKPVPMLASDYSVSPDGMIYDIKLRKGVKFHNGKEMTSEDVVASLQRWGTTASAGKQLFANIESVEASGPYGIVIKLKEKTGLVLPFLAMPNQGAAIYPKEVVEPAGSEPIKEFIGTGPYKFVEWKPNQYIKLARYEDYQPVDLPTSGYGGKKEAYLDELIFYPITDASVRSAGVESGDYDLADFINVDEYENLKAAPRVVAEPSDPRGWFSAVFNKKAGPMSNVKVRQAFLAALDMEPIMLAGYGHPDFWRLDPSIMFKEQQAWWSDAGSDKYNQGDAEKARSLLEEAGYDGTPIRWMTGPLEYNFSLTAKQQLEKAGFVIDLQRVEWATVVEKRSNPELWDIFSTGFTLRADPVQMAFLNPGYAGWWENERKEQLLGDLMKATKYEERYEIWEQIQELFYEDVPVVKVGDYSNLRIWRDNVKGFQNTPYVFFWNVWKE